MSKIDVNVNVFQKQCSEGLENLESKSKTMNMNISGEQSNEVFAEYSLWDYSKYFDMDFLCPFQYWKKEYTCKEEPAEADGESIEDTKLSEDKVILRDDLYRNPALFEVENNEDENTQMQSNGYDWTQQNWLKAGAGSSHKPVQGPSTPGRAFTKMQKKLDNSLSQPPVMNKAESIMIKMGWKGGALGKTGEGITEPIAPNAAYAAKTVGFGRPEPPNKQKVKPKPNNHIITTYNKEYFTTNVLLHILEFVKNEIELSLCFDQNLRPCERKKIHNVVGEMINGDETMYYSNLVQTDLIQQIQSRNCYVLRTESSGEHPNRQLYIYKEAPSHVYLVTPDDLKDETFDDEMEDVEIEIDKKPTECKDSDPLSNMEIEEETNPFLKSITRHLKNEQPEVITTKLEEIKIDASKNNLTPLGKIIDYFSEFVDQDYAEFRFLGPFNSEELDAVNSFVNKVWMCLNKEKDLKDKVEDALLKFFIHETNFGLTQDCNGSVLIYKLKYGYKTNTECVLKK